MRKGRYNILYVTITQDKKICMIKISPMREDGEIDENFLLVKISAYTVAYNFREISCVLIEFC